MRRMFQLALTAAAFAVAFVANTGHASADDFNYDEYRQAMKAFTPVIRGWMGEVEAYASAAKAKPEVLKDAALAELAARGRTIAGDLAGTATPGTHADEHEALTSAIAEIAAAADAAHAADGAAFESLIADDMKAGRTNLRTIFSYAIRR